MDIGIVCAGRCGAPSVEVTTPEIDGTPEPVYAPVGRGWKCTAVRKRTVKVTCKLDG
jgi:hypothetical protein